jgi:hypothetical protein
LIGADEEGTLAQVKAFRTTLVDPTIAKHRGHRGFDPDRLRSPAASCGMLSAKQEVP